MLIGGSEWGGRASRRATGRTVK